MAADLRPGCGWPLAALLTLTAALPACGGTDYQVQTTPHPTPLPPVPGDSPYGQPPDWGSCAGGYHGTYYNLEATHPDVEPPEGEDPATAYGAPWVTDWFDDERRAFERFDSSLDFGPGFWPVDEGWAGDPAYFAAHWLFWVRARSRTTWQVSVAADDDLWVVVDGDVVVSLPGLSAFEPRTVDIPLSAGQYPVQVYFGQRSAEGSALRFRPLPSDIVDTCYPDFDGE